MDKQSSDEEQFEKSLHNSVNIFHKNKNISFEEDQFYRKRSSSMSINPLLNIVPKLKPIKTIICPSPIKLNQKSPQETPDKINTKISPSSYENKNDLNLKPIKFKFSRKRKQPRKSNKIMNIEEENHETEAISDCEDKSKKVYLIYTDSDTSNSNTEENNSNNKIDILKNINFIREKMMIIRKNYVFHENIYDDSSISNNYTKKRLYQNRNIYQQKVINKIRKKNNMISNPSIKYRTKSFNIKQRYVSTILGFLERKNSTNSLNSNGK